ncbi:Formyltetrahydrofolate deformylase [Candidatus Magnetaquicoccaceae bacterium FCR-1]|uniref:Formyltetrahydrofolate deformylase n=1 Tax=Candidatus Magnetaquiglobus chichijimensis TaxID=3141448 RepID=A0ABQ0CA26_9PROT
MTKPSSEIIFLGHCPDRVGLDARITGFFADELFNILDLSQHSERGRFFIRIEGSEEGSPQSIQTWTEKFFPIARELDMAYSFHDPLERLRVVMFCSKTLPCPLEVLSRWLSGEMRIDLRAVVSNHLAIEPIIRKLDLPFYHTPTTGDASLFEPMQIRIIEQHSPDLIVLARYMKILSPHFLGEVRTPIINIHHSFLPSFIGNDPYEQAYRRGVKLIGATAHFVTCDLDEGPIIHQDVVRIGHQFSVPDMKQVGADIEKQVLASALRKFTERKIIQWEGRTVVFH